MTSDHCSALRDVDTCTCAAYCLYHRFEWFGFGSLNHIRWPGLLYPSIPIPYIPGQHQSGWIWQLRGWAGHHTLPGGGRGDQDGAQQRVSEEFSSRYYLLFSSPPHFTQYEVIRFALLFYLRHISVSLLHISFEHYFIFYTGTAAVLNCVDIRWYSKSIDQM